MIGAVAAATTAVPLFWYGGGEIRTHETLAGGEPLGVYWSVNPAH